MEEATPTGQPVHVVGVKARHVGDRGVRSSSLWAIPGVWMLRPIAIFAASRVAVLSAFWLASRLPPGIAMGDLVRSWDANLYYQIIRDGYVEFPVDRGTFAFFPAYPLASRAVSVLPGVGVLEAGLIVGAVAGALSAVALWGLSEHLFGRSVADRTVALLAFFPGSFVLSMLYSEGVMLALSISCLWALVRHQWLLAGVLAAAGTASRPNAVALIAACAWAASFAVLHRREWRALAAPALAPVGILSFWGLLWWRTGDPFTWFTVQRELWMERVDPLALVDDVRVFAAAPFENTNTTVVIIGAVLCVVGLVMLVRSPVPSVLTVYAVVVIALAAGSETLGPRPRFVMTAFPIFVVFAMRLRGLSFALTLAASATVLGAFTVLSVTTVLFTP